MYDQLKTPWLLIATPLLADSEFKQTVVLVVEHNERGSMGFIINRPTTLPLAAVIEIEEEDAVGPVPDILPVWAGGPVRRDTGVILGIESSVPSNQQRSGTVEVSLSATSTALNKLLEEARQAQARQKDGEIPTPLYRYRFICGYSGWGAGQLEQEIQQGAWLQVPASWDLVFNTDWRDMWSRASGQISSVNIGSWINDSGFKGLLH